MDLIYFDNSDNGIRNRYTRILMGNIANVIQIACGVSASKLVLSEHVRQRGIKPVKE